MEQMELYRRLAALERRVNKLESGMQEIGSVIDPKGWIGEAFNILEEHVDSKFASVESQFQSVNAKLDIILQHLTGFDRSEGES